MAGEEPSGTDELNLVDRTIDRIDGWQQRHPVVAFPVAVIRRFSDDRGSQYTAQLTYYGFLSLFPLLLALVTILGIVLESDPDLQRRILQTVLANVPLVSDTLEENVHGLRSSGLVLAVSLLFVLWGGLGVIQGAQDAFNTMWNVPHFERPNIVFRTLRSLAVLGILGASILAVSILGPWVAAISLPGGIRLGSLALFLVGNAVVLVLTFELLTAAKLGIRLLWPGALVGSFLMLVLHGLGGLYISRVVARANDLYGTFAIIIGLVVWISLLARIVLLASEINVVARVHLWPRSLTERMLTDADLRALETLLARERMLTSQEVSVTLVDAGDAGEVRPPEPGS